MCSSDLDLEAFPHIHEDMLQDQIFSYPSTFIIPCSIFDIGLHAKDIKNNLALMGLCPAFYPQVGKLLENKGL